MDIHTIHTISHIQKYIDTNTEESIYLEFKSGDSLRKDDTGKKEIAKDVSAFANSDGGVLIYGIREEKNAAHSLSPVNDTLYTKEWLEQIINNNIKRRIDGVIIDPIRLETGGAIYVVRIPKSPLRPHQTNAYRYYKRFNFQAIDMEEHEVRESYLNPREPHVIVESIYEKAARVERERNSKEERLLLIHSNEGRNLAMKELDKIRPLLDSYKRLFKEKLSNWHFGADSDSRHQYNGSFSVTSYAIYLNIGYVCQITNSAEDFTLTILITSGGGQTFNQYKIHKSCKMKFNIDSYNQPGWSSLDLKNFFSTEKLTSDWFELFIDEALQNKASH